MVIAAAILAIVLTSVTIIDKIVDIITKIKKLKDNANDQ